MSVKAMTWAFDQPLSGSEKVVLLCLADHANDDGLCWPAMAKIAKKACITRRSAQRIVGKLQESGLISLQEQHTETGRDTSNLYRLEMGGRKIVALDTHVTPEGDTGVRVEGDTGVRVLYEPSEGTTRKNHQYDDGFEEFWDAYPKRAGSADKPRALKTYKRLIADKTRPQDLREGAIRYRQWCEVNGKLKTEFVRQAATWLNGRGWEDVYEMTSANDPKARAKAEAEERIRLHNEAYERKLQQESSHGIG